MLNTSQHHQQVLDDHIREDATLKRWEDEDRWIGWFIKNLAGAARRVGLGRPPQALSRLSAAEPIRKSGVVRHG